MNKNKINNYFQKPVLYALVLVFLFLFIGTFVLADEDEGGETSTSNTTVLDLNDELKAIKQKIKDLEAKKGEYEREVQSLRKESLSLQREIALIENKIAQVTVDIETEQAKIDHTNLEIQNVDLEILKTEKEIESGEERLGILLRRLDRTDNSDYLSAFLFNESFSSFFENIRHLELLEGDIFIAVGDMKRTNELLGEQKSLLEEKQNELIVLKDSLEEKQRELEDQEGDKRNILGSTKLSERRFNQLIVDIKREQADANAEIISLEREIRERLAREKAVGSLGGDEQFQWPIDPSRGISAYFHDPEYPFRYIFEHPAIDIRTPQGTPIAAAKSGYVGSAKDAGMGYSYIMLIHDEGYTTVYGHVSGINVREDDYIVQGQTIGRTGGAPGTPGAGRLSTGPHLHFEVRLNGIPVNPLDYLP